MTGPRPTAASRVGRFVVEHLPALVVALLVVPWVIKDGSAWPWRPNMIDLDVYRLAGRTLLDGGDVYAVRTPGWDLPFIYPPIAALLMAPLGLVPRTVLQLLWIVANVLALGLVLRRAGIRRGPTLGALGALLMIAVEPLRTTLGYGQVNLLLMTLVVADLLPDHPIGHARRGRHRRRAGILLGIAAAIKLTPLLFVLYAVATRRWRLAVVTVTTFVVLTGVGALAMPHASATFLRKVLANDLYGDPRYIGNQSLVGAINRLGTSPTIHAVALAAGVVTAVVAALCAARLHARHAGVLAVGTIGVATCLASPIAWTHHYVWAVLVLIGAVAPAGLRVPVWLRAAYAAWAVWVALCPVLVWGRVGPAAAAGRDPGQVALGLVGPLWATLLVMATLAWFIAPARTEPARARSGSRIVGPPERTPAPE
ncbi:glycosyltransferase 87 family protein [Mariniluteicoccus flavus]